jgi:DivIVA domain-containing protein
MEDATIPDGPRRLPPSVPTRESSTADRARNAHFPVVLRGYDRQAVDMFLSELAGLIEELETRQTRESVVQRALEEVGEQTSAILKQAHEAADELTARSRSQAEGRMQRARREADELMAQAEERARRIERDTEVLWGERGRLIEEVRRLADEILAVADGAMERLPPPAWAEAAEASAEAADAPTEETPLPSSEPAGPGNG